jgi:SNF2 family DNA or RNA helicase
MAHQEGAVALGSKEPDIFLAWEPGTGKSCATIQVLRHKYAAEGRLMKTLILAPKVVLDNWKNEFKLYSKVDQKYIYVLKGPLKARTNFFKSMVPYSAIAITNYDAFQNEEFCKAVKEWGPEILVCDESHIVKSYKSKRAKNVAQIADKCRHRYLLTGTPILNSIMDLFQQYRILDGYLGSRSTFGHNFFAFRNKFFYDRNAAWAGKSNHYPEWVPRPGAEDHLMKLISKKTLRVEKSQCMDLPPLVVQELQVEMSAEQARLYREMKKDFVTYLNEKAVVANLAIVKALRLQQIVSGFVKTDDGQIVRLSDVPRLEALREQLEMLTPKHKVIVWACFKENYAMIREVCKDLGIEAVELHGDVSDKDRKTALARFEIDSNVRVLIGNQGAAGIGINLVNATYAIYYSRGFRLGDDIQSEARNYRRGSEVHDKVTRINLVCPGTIDNLIADALQSKLDLSDKFLNYIKERGSDYGI